MQEIQEKNVNNLINRILTERSADFTWACFSPEQDFYEDYFDTQQDYQEQQIIQPNPTLEILTKITDGKAELSDLDELEELCNYVKNNSLCGLGQTSPNPVLSTLRYFRDEYVEHITEHKCRAGVCKNMTKYVITDKCIGCSACSRVCPVSAISGEIKKKFEIDQEKCVKCGKCYETCRFGAIVRE